MISVKEFAFENKVSESIIYRHIRNHKEALGENVRRQHGRTWLTDEGVSFIKSLMTQQTIVREKANDVVRNLEQELLAKNASIQAQADIIKALELKLEGFEENKKLLEDGQKKIDALEDEKASLGREIEVQRGKVAEAEKRALEANSEAYRAKEELQAEKSRKLTWKERLLGRKIGE